MTDFYCSVLARDTQEPLIGTAQLNTVHFVMAVPKTRWLSHAENMEGDAGELARLIKPLKDYAMLSLRNAPDEEGTIWLFPHAFRFEGLTTADYPELLRQVQNGEINMPHQAMPRRTTILVCAHGKRDACCAKFGGEVIGVLRNQAPQNIDVWEVSHLGGHRFAATMVVQPHNHWYGHITPDDVPALLKKIADGAVLSERYRGNATYPPPMQVAEKWAWDTLRELGQNGEIYLINPEVKGRMAQVTVALDVAGNLQFYALLLEGEPYSFRANCGNDEIKDRLIWHVVSVEDSEFITPNS